MTIGLSSVFRRQDSSSFCMIVPRDIPSLNRSLAEMTIILHLYGLIFVLRKKGISNKIPSNNIEIPNKLQVPIAKFQKNPRIGICHLEFRCDLNFGNWIFLVNFLDLRNKSYYRKGDPRSEEHT